VGEQYKSDDMAQNQSQNFSPGILVLNYMHCDGPESSSDSWNI